MNKTLKKNYGYVNTDIHLDSNKSIFLVGMMGAGKTTLGRALARKLGWEFIDLDHELEERCGVRIAIIFEIEGEAGFRKREAALLDEYTQRSGIVLATGGGVVINPKNQDLLRKRGLVVYLRASVDELYRRVEFDRSRPLLQTNNPKERLQELLSQREPIYSRLANLVFDTGNLPIAQTVNLLLHKLQQYKPASISTNKGQVMQNAQTVKVIVNTSGGDYPIHIGSGRINKLNTAIPPDASSIALVTNEKIFSIYGKQALNSLKKSGHKVIQIILPDGEEHKNWETLNKIFDVMLQNNLDRKAVLVALGGGVIGDMVGFAAATYMRGIRFIQVPTTLLAQVDSSVGGKTAINHPLGKNMVGAFYQPIAVEIDTDVLSTLPKREISAGLAEVIKYGMIIDDEFFAWCEENIDDLRQLQPQAITYAIKRSCQLKAYVVSTDERESGIRAILNFGHTFGHAIEAGLGYGKWLHGEAVGCGMIQAAHLSQLTLGLPESDVKRIKNLVEQSGSPTVAPDLGTERWLELMKVDKKAQGGNMRFVLLENIGSAIVKQVDADKVIPVLQNTIE